MIFTNKIVLQVVSAAYDSLHDNMPSAFLGIASLTPLSASRTFAAM